jgi:ribonuclease BN (tRNA processing enzyme)
LGLGSNGAMMRICLLGTGSPAPLPERQGSAVLLAGSGQNLVIDAGRGVTTQLVRAGVQPAELSAILLTHHHYDHIGNLGDLLLTAWHGGAPTIQIIGPPGTRAIVTALLEQVYRRELLFSYALARAVGEQSHTIHEVVTVTEMVSGQSYQQGACHIAAYAVDHGRQLGLTFEEWPCLGYRIEAEGKVIAISGDTILCDGVLDLAREADVLIQCCFRAEQALTTLIASSGQAGQIAARSQARQLVLTHFSPMSSELLESMVADIRRHYAGPLVFGEDLMEIHP